MRAKSAGTEQTEVRHRPFVDLCLENRIGPAEAHGLAVFLKQKLGPDGLIDPVAFERGRKEFRSAPAGR